MLLIMGKWAQATQVQQPPGKYAWTSGWDQTQPLSLLQASSLTPKITLTWRQPDSAGRDRRDVKQQRETGFGIQLQLKMVGREYFYILLCELRIYFNQTRGYCGKTNKGC